MVVYDDGVVVRWDEATDPGDPVIEGEMTMQPDVDDHVKYHWTMPEGIERVLAVHHRENPAFEMRLTIGIGCCPHSGYLAKEEASNTAPVAVDFAPPPDGVIPAAQWLSHAAADDAADLEGQTTEVSFKTFVFE